MLRYVAFALLITFLLSGCGLNFKRGNGRIESREFELSGFERIYAGGNYDLTLIPADKDLVIIETDENLFRHINVEVFNKSLNINNVRNLKGSKGILVDVYYQNLTRLSSTGTSKIKTRGMLKTERLDVNLSGAGSIELEVETELLDVQMSGAGVVNLTGNTRKQEIHISGAGGLRASGLRSEECEVNLSGLGNANIFVTEKLIATITGIGGIKYSGNPGYIERKITGLGKIERHDK